MLKKTWFKGAIIGLIFAGTLYAAAITGLGERTGLETGVQYFSSLPLFIAMKAWSQAPDWFIAGVFFFYWVIVGALIGCAIKKGIVWKGVALIILILLGFLHVETKAILEDELAAAATAFGNFFLETALLRK